MPGHIFSIEPTATILRQLSGRTRRLPVVDLAGELALPKGTIHGLLRTLQAVGFVEQDAETGKYQLGAALLHMGSRDYLDGNELRARALIWSDSLAARAHEAVRIATLHDSQVLIVHHVFRPGRHAPVPRCRLPPAGPRHRTGIVGSPSLRWRRTQPTRAFAHATITPDAALDREFARVREQDWGAEIGELFSHHKTRATPLKDRRGLVVGAIGIYGGPDGCSTGESRAATLVSPVLEAGRAVSRGARRSPLVGMRLGLCYRPDAKLPTCPVRLFFSKSPAEITGLGN